MKRIIKLGLLLMLSVLILSGCNSGENESFTDSPYILNSSNKQDYNKFTSLDELCSNEQIDLESGEIDVDCGGDCFGCGVGKICTEDVDCSSKLYCASDKKCTQSSCSDGIKNGNEVDIDCGYTCGDKLCQIGQKCFYSDDCESNFCNLDGFCLESTCLDGILNEDEEGIDCGGSCLVSCFNDKTLENESQEFIVNLCQEMKSNFECSLKENNTYNRNDNISFKFIYKARPVQVGQEYRLGVSLKRDVLDSNGKNIEKLYSQGFPMIRKYSNDMIVEFTFGQEFFIDNFEKDGEYTFIFTIVDQYRLEESTLEQKIVII